MRKNTKKVLTGTLVASFVLGLGLAGVLHNQAYAATGTTNGTSAQQSHAGRGGHGPMGFGGDIVAETATVLGVDPSAVKEALQGGKTLAAFAQDKGVSEADLLQKLIAAETDSLKARVTDGKLTQDQADKMLAGLSDRLTKQIEGTQRDDDFGKGFRGHRGPGPGPGPGPGFGWGNEEALTTILGMTPDELKAQRDAGKSIAEIAAAKGISEDDLINKIKDGMTDSIKKFVEDTHSHHQPKGNASADANSASK